jgi:hypothetical protein
VTTYDASAEAGDWYPAIQAAIDDACVAGAAFYDRPPPVFLPPGRFPTSQPLFLHCNNLELEGACRNGTTIVPQFAGPAILINPGNAITLPTGPALVGTGSSYQTEIVQHGVYVNLRDMPEVELDGLPAFTAEAFIDLTAPYPPGYAGIVNSTGCNTDWSGAFPCASAFTLAVETQALSGSLTAGGTVYTLNGPTITLSTVHHTALTYDGAAVRLFLDGAIVATTPATGPVTMQAPENVTIGEALYQLEASSVGGPMPGSIDSVRLSSVARYTTAFTPPTAELAADSSTLALVNFDTNVPGLTLAASKDGPFWLPVRRSADSLGNVINFVGGVSVHHLAVEGGMGIFGWLAATTSIYQADCVGCDYGFALMGNNYLGRLDDVTATAGGGRGRFGVVSFAGNGNGFHDVSVSGQTFPFVSLGAAEQILTNVTVTAGPSTMYGVTLVTSDDALDGVRIDASGAGSAWRGAIAGVEPWAKLQVQRGTIATANAAPAIVIDKGAGVLVEGTSFTNTAGSPEVIHLAAATTDPNIVLAAVKDSTVPWSDDPSLVVPAGPDPAAVPDPTTLPATALGPSVVRGEVPASSVFDVTTYGATSGGTDAAPGIQAAVDAACTHGGGTVFLHTGDYWIDTPVLVHCGGITIEGASRILTGIVMRTSGPGLVLNPPSMTGIELAPALVGTGNAMRTDGASYWLELRDDPLVELSGLSAFTAEAFVELTAVPTGYAGIVQSYGCLGTGATLPGCTSAFTLAMTGQTLSGALAVGAATYALQGPVMSTGVVHHVALTYDGATIRLFLDGALVASDAATGTVTQGIQEDVTAGPRTTGFDGAVLDPAIPGVMDSIRLSSSARYTAAFTPPTAKLGSDATSLIVVNFATNAAGSTLASDANGSGRWIAVRRTAEPSGAAEGTISGVTLRSFTLEELFGMNAIGGRYLEMIFGGDSAIELEGTSAGSYFEMLDVGAGGRGRYGMLLAGGDGNVYRDLSVAYAEMPLVAYGGANQLFVNAVLSPAPATGVYGALLVNAGTTFEGLYFDNESTMPLFAGDVVAAGSLAPFTLLKGEIDLGSQGLPITIDRGDGVVIEGASFGNSNLAPEVVHVSAPTTGQEEAIGVTFSSAELSDDPSFVSVGN